MADTTSHRRDDLSIDQQTALFRAAASLSGDARQRLTALAKVEGLRDGGRPIVLWVGQAGETWPGNSAKRLLAAKRSYKAVSTGGGEFEPPKLSRRCTDQMCNRS